MPEAPLRLRNDETGPALPGQPKAPGAAGLRRNRPSHTGHRPSGRQSPFRVFRPRPVPPGATTTLLRPISPNSTTIPLFRSLADPRTAAGFTCPLYRKQSPPGPKNGRRHRQPGCRSANGRRLHPLPRCPANGDLRTGRNRQPILGLSVRSRPTRSAVRRPDPPARSRPHTTRRRTKNVPAGSIRQGRNRICNGRSADPSPADTLLRQPREQLRSLGGRTAASHRQAGRAYCLTLLALFAARALSTSMMKSDSTFM